MGRRSGITGVELRHLRYFETVCAASSFSRAAEILHVTQSTLSHQVHQLEEELGTRLLHRLGRRIEPTAAGELFLVHCSNTLRAASAGVAAIHELQGLVRGELRVAVFHSFGNSRMPRVFADFSEKFPGIHIVARQLSRDVMERELISGQLDLAIGYADSDDPQIESSPLYRDSLVLVIGGRHSWKQLKSVPMQRLQELSLVLLTPEFGSRAYLDAYFSREKIQPRIVLEMNALEPILAVIRDTSLATVMQLGAIGNVPHVRTIKLTDPIPERRAALLWRKLGEQSPAARRMVEMIQAVYS